MIPAAPASIAGLVSFAAAPVSIWSQLLIEPRCPNIAWLMPGVLVGVSGYFWSFCADSSVSFTQRPELAAISEPFCATEAPALKATPRRGNPAFDDRPTDAMKR